MVLTRLITTALAALAFFVFAPVANAALSAEEMYEPSTVVAIELGMEPDAQAELEAEPDEYVEATFALYETDGTPGGMAALPIEPPLTVGLRLKGSASFEGLGGKAAFKVKFDEFVDDQTLLGLEKMTLNNMIQDPSMLHEALAYEAFDAAGVPAPHAGYAYVHLNGIDYGMHLNLETLDKIALKKRFGDFEDPPQHLYEAGANTDVLPAPGMLEKFEVDEGEEDDLSDLEALITAANESEPGFSERVKDVVDLGEMVRMWAGERYLGQVDGYTGPNVNNYYLYSDLFGRFQMIPWGVDQSLYFPTFPFTGGHSGTLYAQCIFEPACFAAYEDALRAVRQATLDLDLGGQAAALAARLAPWQELELAESTRAPFDASEIAAAVDQTLDFIDGRPAALAKFLGEPWPPPPPPPPIPVEPAEVILHPEPTKPPSPAISGRIEVERAGLDRGLLTVHPAVSGPGSLSLRGTYGPRDARRRACQVEPKRVRTATPVLHCRFSKAARARLAERPLTLRLTITFRPGDGSAPLTVTRLARLPRQAS